MMTSSIFKDWRLYVFGGLFLFNLAYVLALSVPNDYPVGTIITLEKGAGLAEIAEDLESKGVVRSAIWFRAAVIVLGGERGIQAGDYYLERRQNSIILASRIISGKRDIATVKITIPEGFTNEEIAKLFDGRFKSFERDVFLALAPQGYMFPDTYFIQVNVTAGDVVDLFQNNFERRTQALRGQIQESEHTEDEIMTMASIIEAEVRSAEDKAMVSGILWKRLSIGMALQVDPAPETYEVRGLPKKPINNPGLLSIEAALNPKASPYFYFLSGKDGKTYYAKTLEEHNENIRKHL